MEIRECSCHWCWEICWKYAVCSVHRARPWACPRDLALVITRMSPLTRISSSLSPGAFQLGSASTALVSISLPSLQPTCIPISRVPWDHPSWEHSGSAGRKNPSSSARLSTRAEKKGAGKISGNLRLYSPSPGHHLHYNLENLPCFRTLTQVLLGKGRPFSSVNFSCYLSLLSGGSCECHMSAIHKSILWVQGGEMEVQLTGKCVLKKNKWVHNSK